MANTKFKTDRITKRWIRDASDELAAREGCRFDEARGQFVVDWIEKYLKLYEGELAGQPLLLTGHWTYEAVMRLFGWVRRSEQWGREIRRFRRASWWVPKKNMKTPVLAAIGLYCLAGDGELGQKCFFFSRDSRQVRENAVRHAIEMVRASPDLLAECKIYATTATIEHLATRSFLLPITVNNELTQQAKEGLNGSCFIDETHVVDEGAMGRMDRAGISRSEPIILQVSTVGDDPESYGKREFDRGQKIAAGELPDTSYLFIAYAAPQTLSDAELAADPVKWGRLANPAWGHTVNEQEFLSDYHRSKLSLGELARFKKYRLNIWQRSAAPWLDMSRWEACGEDYRERDLEGEPCYAGLDLAKTRDTSALVLVFPLGPDAEGGWRYRQLAWHWLPEERAHELRDQVRYLEWARDDWLALTPGSTVDYARIERDVLAIMERFGVERLGFDSTYAQQMIQRLIETHGLAEERFCQFPQTVMAFAGATAAYQRLVLAGRIAHPENPLFTWQAGNTTVKYDVNGNMRPVKPKHGDYHTIDGAVAAIMALALALAEDGGRSVYESRGMVEL